MGLKVTTPFPFVWKWRVKDMAPPAGSTAASRRKGLPGETAWVVPPALTRTTCGTSRRRTGLRGRTLSRAKAKRPLGAVVATVRRPGEPAVKGAAGPMGRAGAWATVGRRVGPTPPPLVAPRWRVGVPPLPAAGVPLSGPTAAPPTPPTAGLKVRPRGR